MNDCIVQVANVQGSRKQKNGLNQSSQIAASNLGISNGLSI